MREENADFQTALIRAGGEIRMTQAGSTVSLRDDAFLAGGQVDARE